MNTILKRYKLSFIILILPFLYPACKSDVEQIPEVNVNIALDLNDPSFFDLNSSGNGLEITGGVPELLFSEKVLMNLKPTTEHAQTILCVKKYTLAIKHPLLWIQSVVRSFRLFLMERF